MVATGDIPGALFMVPSVVSSHFPSFLELFMKVGPSTSIFL